jgi:predicted nucleic-acid-binding protein
VPLLVVVEVIWVLQSVYETPNSEILAALSDLLLMLVLLFESAHNTKFDLSDLLIAHSAYSLDYQSVFTFDKKASKFKYFVLLK